MPYTRTFNAQARRFEAHFNGKVTADEIVQNYMEMIQSPEWGPDVVRLIVIEAGSDLSDITLDLFQNRFVQLLEDTADIAGPPNKNTWVFESELTAAIGQLWELMPEAGELDVFRVFRTRKAALDWLES
jgi:hypothetical protein